MYLESGVFFSSTRIQHWSVIILSFSTFSSINLLYLVFIGSRLALIWLAFPVVSNNICLWSRKKPFISYRSANTIVCRFSACCTYKRSGKGMVKNLYPQAACNHVLNAQQSRIEVAITFPSDVSDLKINTFYNLKSERQHQGWGVIVKMKLLRSF